MSLTMLTVTMMVETVVSPMHYHKIINFLQFLVCRQMEEAI
jgi:hypothetical protein